MLNLYYFEPMKSGKKLILFSLLALCLLAGAFGVWNFHRHSQKQEPSFLPEKITIKGDTTCVSNTTAALNLLKKKSPESYQEVERYIGIIECVTAGSGMYPNETPPRFAVGNETRDAGTIWYAGAIVHDSNHSKLYNQYALAHPGQQVPPEVWTGKQAESECIDVQYKALQDIGADAATLQYLKSTINSNYWEQQNRYW